MQDLKLSRLLIAHDSESAQSLQQVSAQPLDCFDCKSCYHLQSVHRILSLVDTVSWSRILAPLALGRHAGQMDALLVELGERTHKCVLHLVIGKICVVVGGSYR